MPKVGKNVDFHLRACQSPWILFREIAIGYAGPRGDGGERGDEMLAEIEIVIGHQELAVYDRDSDPD
jgi:hypothetical protein